MSPCPGRATTPRRILVLRAGALGDTIVALPALTALRRGYPAARLALVGNARAGALLRDAGHVDESYPFDDRWVTDLYVGGDASSELRARLADVDLAVVWARSSDSPAAESLRRLGIPTLAAPSFSPPGVRQHICDHLLGTLASLALPALEPRPSLTLPDTARAFARDLWHARRLTGATVVALHVGSGSPRKNWPAKRFAAVADRLADQGRRVLLVSGPADEAPARAFLAAARSRVEVVEAPTLSQLAGCLARADAYLGNDSGVSHLAAAVGSPTVAVFGPTDPALWAPRGPKVIVLCRGALWLPPDSPPIGDGVAEGSLDDVSAEAALSAVRELLELPT